MKIGVIPDIHGCTGWKNNINKLNDCQKIIFLGDYVDSFNAEEKGLPALKNCKDIIKFKDDNPDRVDLLVGNHEFENYWFYYGKCSGFQYACYESYHNFFVEHAACFKIAVEYEGWVFSHAGISKVWLDNLKTGLKYRIPDFEFPENDLDLINDLLVTKNVSSFSFYENDWSGCGNNVAQGPLWIRPEALIESHAYDKQVVGHTELRIANEYAALEQNGLKLLLVDTPSHSTYYILDTENPPEFKSPMESAREQKKAEKEALNKRAVNGQRRKDLMIKYNITKNELLAIESKFEDKTSETYWDDVEKEIKLLCSITGSA